MKSSDCTRNPVAGETKGDKRKEQKGQPGPRDYSLCVNRVESLYAAKKSMCTDGQFTLILKGYEIITQFMSLSERKIFERRINHLQRW